MNKEIELANKKEDKKQIGKLIVFLLGCGLAGFVGGFGMAFMDDTSIMEFLKQAVPHFLMVSSIYMPMVLALISLVFFMYTYGKAKKLHATWDGEDEDVYQKIEELLSWALMPTMVSQVLSLVFMAIGFKRLDELAGGELHFGLAIFALGLVFCTVFMMVGQVKVINFEKVLNPEKKGSALDLKFQEKWMDSFDEAELFETYRAAFAAYKAVNSVCMVLWFVCLFGMMLFDFGLVPVCMVGVIWLTAMISYVLECIKNSKKKVK